MKEVAKASELPEVIQNLISESNQQISIGDIYMDNGGQYFKIINFFVSDRYSKGSQERVEVHIKNGKYKKSEDWESHDSLGLQGLLTDLNNCRIVKVDFFNVEHLKNVATDILDGKISASVYINDDYGEINEERAVMAKSSKESLLALQKSINNKRALVATIEKFMGLEIEKRKKELSKIKEQLYGAVELMGKQMAKLQRVITTIELYLGVDEELHQIMEGENAPVNEPITFRQQVLFIDEEVGVHEDGGLDFTDIEKFDEWLITNENYKIVAPEEKCLVVLRPRRYNKDYKDPYENATKNVYNRIHTYFLIRNGKNIYRIFTEKLVVIDRMFPKRTELMELYEKMQNATWDRDKEKIENEMYGFKKRAIFMQGLIDRTTVFHPLPAENINIFKLDELGNKVRFIYDDEATLPSGRLSFTSWKELINRKIKKGSRVLCTGYGGSKDYEDRFLRYYANDFNIPKTPNKDIYQVDEYVEKTTEWLREEDYFKIVESGIEHSIIKTDEKKFSRRSQVHAFDYVKGYLVEYKKTHFIIKYDAGGEVWGGWGKGSSDRKNKVSFKINIHDSNILNYDQIDLEDIEFYLKSRVDRKNYLSMMPVLKELRVMRKKEMESEKSFARLLWDRNMQNVPKGINQNDWITRELWSRIYESIDWWKFKNEWKRPIEKDDELALRMIEKRITSLNYNKLKK